MPAAWEERELPLSSFLFSFSLFKCYTEVSIKLSQIPPTSFLDPPALILKPSNFMAPISQYYWKEDKVKETKSKAALYFIRKPLQPKTASTYVANDGCALYNCDPSADYPSSLPKVVNQQTVC